MNREIPGYYFDADKKKYFTILPNHIGRGSEYSSEVVRAKAEAERTRTREHEHKTRARQQLLTHSKLLNHPLLDFRRQLDDHSRRATTEVADYFCAALTRQRPFRSVQGESEDGGVIWSKVESTGPKFTVNEDTGDLFTTASRCLGRFKRTSSENRYLWECRGPMFDPLIPLPYEIEHLLLIPGRCVVLSGTFTNGLSTIMALGMGNFSSPSSDSGCERDVNTSTYSFTTGDDRIVWDMTASQHDPTWAVASNTGVDLYDAIAERKLEGPAGLKTREQMTVSYRDRYTLAAGSRFGRVRFGDTRGGSIDRICHSSAVNAIKTLKNDNLVLVSGLRSTSVYDLRQTATTPSALKSKAHTTPYMSFNMPQNLASDRYGLGFDFDPELGIVASATSNAKSHHVLLHSVYTGKLIKQSALNRLYGRPVTCIKIARVRDGPKSILLTSGQKMDEWTAIGAVREKSD